MDNCYSTNYNKKVFTVVIIYEYKLYKYNIIFIIITWN